MLKRLLTFFMTLSIFTLSAGADTNIGLKNALEELNYSLTVEWDQNDQDFYTSERAKFEKTLDSLIANGLDYHEYMNFLSSELKNERIAADIEMMINNVSLSKMTTDEATEHIMAMMQRTHLTGASWIGGLDAGTVIGAGLMIGLVVWIGIELKKYGDAGGHF